MKRPSVKPLLQACGLFAMLAGASMQAQAAFGVTTTKDASNRIVSYTIDTDAGLVFKVRGFPNDTSTTSPGDLSSIVYNGVEYQDAGRGTQVNSGYDFIYTDQTGVEVKAEVVDANGNALPVTVPAAGQSAITAASDYIKVTVKTVGSATGVLTHYYLVRKGDPRIYMGTHFTAEPTGQALVRFIARLRIAALPSGTPAGTPGGLVVNADPNRPPSWPDDLRNTSGAIESADIFGISTGANAGETRSKHYSNMRLKDWAYIGGTGPNVGVWIVRDNNEGGSGGPFYRSLLNQITSTNNEITYIVNYGEGQTEGFRFNRLNAYTMVFNNGAAPGAVDTSWFSKMNLLGYVPPTARGNVFVPAIYGRNAAFPYTVGFANATAQYWADAASNDGHVNADGMIPGSYTMTVYKNELAVATAPVNVVAGTTNIVPALTIAADPLVNNDDPRGKWHIAKGDPSLTQALFRIGEWDGTPKEFLNGDKVTVMHPSDVRMSSWFATASSANPYLVGSSKAGLHMPAFQWKGLTTAPNGPVTISFFLKASQISAASTYRFRIGVTTAQAGGRPQINVNSWTSPFVGTQSGDALPPSQPSTRTMTVGTYRARNITYDYTIPASALVAGQNTLKVWVVSGSTSSSSWLTPAVSYDAMDLVKIN
jgi:rhamnogalacturonan endolyase